MTNTWNPLEIIAEQEANRAAVRAMLVAQGVIREGDSNVPAAREYIGRHRKPAAAVEFRGMDADGFAVYYGPSLGW